MKTRHWFLLLTAGIACLVSGCNRDSTVRATSAAVNPIDVRTIRPTRGPITRNISLPGGIRAYQQATLCAKVGGYLRSIPVDKGDSIAAGALVADLEVPELSADLARFKAEVVAARLDYQRLSESQKKAPDLVLPQAVDNARAKLEVATAEVDRVETLLRYAKITAPFSGIVIQRNVDPGAFIPAATGSSAQSSAIITLADFSRVRVQVAVPEGQASLVSTGLPVKVTVEGIPGKKFDGTITRFSYALDEATKTMLAEAELANPNLWLRPGMYATVQIGIEHREGALLVPVEAVVTEKAGMSVFLLADGRTKKTRVQIGFNDGANVEILDGIQPDQPVILAGKLSLNDHQAVTVVGGK